MRRGLVEEVECVAPLTPPAQVFHLGPLTREIAMDSTGKAWRMEELDMGVQHGVVKLQELGRSLMSRREAVMTYAADRRPPEESVEELVHQMTGVIDDSVALTVAMEALINICAGVRAGLREAMAVHPYFGAMVEMVEILNRLRALYSGVGDRLDNMEQSLGPLRETAVRLDEMTATLTRRVNTMPDECSRAVQPMLDALHRSVKQELEPLRHLGQHGRDDSGDGVGSSSGRSANSAVVDVRMALDEADDETMLTSIHDALSKLEGRMDTFERERQAGGAAGGRARGGVVVMDDEVQEIAKEDYAKGALKQASTRKGPGVSSIDDRVCMVENLLTDAALEARIAVCMKKMGLGTCGTSELR